MDSILCVLYSTTVNYLAAYETQGRQLKPPIQMNLWCELHLARGWPAWKQWVNQELVGEKSGN